jgi:hypothetical protein
MLTSFAVGVYFAANVVQQVRGVRPLSMPCSALASGLGSPRATTACVGTRLIPPHLRRDWGSPLPHLRRDRAHPSHICIGTWLTAGPWLHRCCSSRSAGSGRRSLPR